MISRRSFLSVFALIAVTACAAPLLNEEQAANLQVRSVTVDISQFENGVAGRNIAIPSAQVKADLEAALRRTLGASSQGNADVVVVLTKMWLVSPGQSIMLGGNSSITGIVSVASVHNGQPILAPTEVVGISNKRTVGGIIGALSRSSAEEDYRETITGFALNLKKRLFGG